MTRTEALGIIKTAREKGEQPVLNWADLSGAVLSGADLSDAVLSGAVLSGAVLNWANLNGANLNGANLSGADLHGANLSGADLNWANLNWANLSGAQLSEAILSGADLRDADLSGANLSGADLSGCKGLLDPIDWLEANLEHTADGIICYKAFGTKYAAPAHWEIKPGAILTEVVNPLPTLDCACGVNVATLAWCRANNKGKLIWKCLIRWPWAASIVVPYNTDGKFRCGRVEEVEEIKE